MSAGSWSHQTGAKTDKALAQKALAPVDLTSQATVRVASSCFVESRWRRVLLSR